MRDKRRRTAMADFNLETALNNENLTDEEKTFIRGVNSKNTITTEDDFKKAIIEAQKECAIAVSNKDLLDKDGVIQISAEEIKSAWQVLEKADSKDTVLQAAKQRMLDKSEQAMEIAAEQIAKDGLTDSAAMDMHEWLVINDSLNNPKNQVRNQKVRKTVNAQLQEYDEVNGMAAATAENADTIEQAQTALMEAYGAFNPFVKQENGNLVHSAFEPLEQFYANLEIEGASAAESAEVKQRMLALAKQRTMSELSVNPEYWNGNEGVRQKLFLDTLAQNMEIGAATLITAQETIDANGEFKTDKVSKKLNKKNKKYATELQEKFSRYIENAAPNQKLTISADAATGAQAALLQANIDYNKRLTQKTGRFSFINKAREHLNRFKEKHPKIAATMKVLGTIGLTVSVSMLGGAAGMAALGAYRTYKAIRKGCKECGSFKKMLKSPKHMIGVGTALAGTLLSTYGVMELGSAANGMLGNMGVGGTVDAFKDMAGSAWSHVTHPIDSVTSLAKGAWHGAKWVGSHLTDGNISDTAGKTGNFLTNSWHNLLHPGAAVDAAAASGNETARILATQRVGRLFVGVGSSLATFSMDVTEALKKQGGKAKTKAILKALGKAVGISALSVAAYEYGTHAAASAVHADNGQDVSHGGGNSNHTGQTHEGNLVETPEAQKFNQIFQGENEQNLEKACNRAPSVVIKDLQAKGILPEDYKLKSSHKLLNDIREIYAHNTEANPQELSDYVNANQKRFLDAMNADNARKILRESASATKDIAEDQINNIDNLKVINKDLTHQPLVDKDDTKTIRDALISSAENATQTASSLPTHEEMFNLNNTVAKIYNNQETQNFGVATQQGVKDAVASGILDKAHAGSAAQIMQDVYQEQGDNAGRTFDAVRKGAMQMMQEEKEGNISESTTKHTYTQRLISETKGRLSQNNEETSPVTQNLTRQTRQQYASVLKGYDRT